MSRVVVIVEGPTEESFVKGPLAEALWPRQVFVNPIILGVPGHKGGRPNYARLRKDLIRQLKQDQGAYCSTMIDFYGLGKAYPGTATPLQMTSLQNVEYLEQEIKRDICSQIPTLRPDVRLIPFLALHEFEGLLFSDPDALANALKQPHQAPHFHGIRNGFPTPEDINNSPHRAPSKRIEAVYPAYKKVIEGTLAAGAVGIARMRKECTHFRGWVEQLEQISGL
ncbi:MAG: DUF4276 family protein [Burkholderiales bacterium]